MSELLEIPLSGRELYAKMQKYKEYVFNFNAFFNKWVTHESMNPALIEIIQTFKKFNDWGDYTLKIVNESNVWEMAEKYNANAIICRMCDFCLFFFVFFVFFVFFFGCLILFFCTYDYPKTKPIKVERECQNSKIFLKIWFAILFYLCVS